MLFFLSSTQFFNTPSILSTIVLIYWAQKWGLILSHSITQNAYNIKSISFSPKVPTEANCDSLTGYSISILKSGQVYNDTFSLSNEIEVILDGGENYTFEIAVVNNKGLTSDLLSDWFITNMLGKHYNNLKFFKL